MHEDSNFSLRAQGIDANVLDALAEAAYDSVSTGVSNSRVEFEKDKGLFSFRGMKPLWVISHIKKIFTFQHLLTTLNSKVKHMRSHGADYYLIQGKALLCFKKMDSKGRVNGFYSARFKAIMAGGSVNYSRAMMLQLSDMGIEKPLPVYYVGYILDRIGRLVDVRLVHYKDGKIVHNVSLKRDDDDNLFNIQNLPTNLPVGPKPGIEELVKIKNKSS